VKRLGWLAILAGCGFQGTSSNNTIDAGTPIVDASVPGDSDGSDTMPPDAPPPDAQQCFGVGLLKLCLTKPPTGDMTLSTPINTDTAGTCTQVFTQIGSPNNAPELCAITGKTITVQGTVTVQGSRALVLIASDTITVAQGATLDASSTTSPARLGPGANLGACARPGNPDNSTDGAGGGAGGSLATKGGDGGVGNLNAKNPQNPSRGGAAGGTQPAPTLLRGGCAGGKGGDGKTLPGGVGNGGLGGNGGGAVYLIAGTSITVTGDVFASGSGGGTRAGADGLQQGGGGGGTGGLIGFDAPTVIINGKVAANGGAGGGGGSGTGGTAGGDGTTTNWNARAVGGSPGTGGANGAQTANGASGTAVALTDQITGGNADLGGGGGGGGLGIITVYGTLTSQQMMISPAPTKH
jgi:hypothetical protein